MSRACPGRKIPRMTRGIMPDPFARKHRRWLWVIAIGLPLIGVAALARWVETMPIGTGEARRSPGGRY